MAECGRVPRMAGFGSFCPIQTLPASPGAGGCRGWQGSAVKRNHLVSPVSRVQDGAEDGRVQQNIRPDMDSFVQPCGMVPRMAGFGSNASGCHRWASSRASKHVPLAAGRVRDCWAGRWERRGCNRVRGVEGVALSVLFCPSRSSLSCNRVRGVEGVAFDVGRSDATSAR